MCSALRQNNTPAGNVAGTTGRMARRTRHVPEYGHKLPHEARAGFEDYQPPAPIAERLDLLIALVREIVNKLDRNEYKRQQAAPGLKVTTRAFGIGRRFPIAQRFFEE